GAAGCPGSASFGTRSKREGTARPQRPGRGSRREAVQGRETLRQCPPVGRGPARPRDDGCGRPFPDQSTRFTPERLENRDTVVRSARPGDRGGLRTRRGVVTRRPGRG